MITNNLEDFNSIKFIENYKKKLKKYLKYFLNGIK